MKATLLLLSVAVVHSFSPGANAPAAAAAQGNSPDGKVPVQASLDFQAYRDRIEPIFLKKRTGGMRCYDCHSLLPTRLRLDPYPAAFR